jgi:glutamate-1-semialdehyde 2,1-aminomutase
LKSGMGALGGKLRRALVLQGVDLGGTSGLITGAHSQEDIDRTVEAFDAALERLQGEGAFKS